MSYPWTTVDESAQASAVLGGTAGTTYDVALRVRLQAELKSHSGGTVVQTYVKEGGAPANDGLGDIIKLQISDPAHDYYLNAVDGVASVGAVSLDYNVTIPIKSGATITLYCLSVDGKANRTVIIGSSTFEGIFGQADGDYSQLTGCSGIVFSGQPVVFLYDYAQKRSPVWMERKTMDGTAGTAAWFDPVLNRFVGGYDGATPIENTFTLRDVPAGNYALRLYANQGTPPDTSTFHVSVNGGAETVKTNTPSVLTSFVEDGNFVKFDLSLATPSKIQIKTLGYLAGLQLLRV